MEKEYQEKLEAVYRKLRKKEDYEKYKTLLDRAVNKWERPIETTFAWGGESLILDHNMVMQLKIYVDDILREIDKELKEAIV